MRIARVAQPIPDRSPCGDGQVESNGQPIYVRGSRQSHLLVKTNIITTGNNTFFHLVVRILQIRAHSVQVFTDRIASCRVITLDTMLKHMKAFMA